MGNSLEKVIVGFLFLALSTSISNDLGALEVDVPSEKQHGSADTNRTLLGRVWLDWTSLRMAADTTGVARLSVGETTYELILERQDLRAENFTNNLRQGKSVRTEPGEFLGTFLATTKGGPPVSLPFMINEFKISGMFYDPAGHLISVESQPPGTGAAPTPTPTTMDTMFFIIWDRSPWELVYENVPLGEIINADGFRQTLDEAGASDSAVTVKLVTDSSAAAYTNHGEGIWAEQAQAASYIAATLDAYGVEITHVASWTFDEVGQPSVDYHLCNHLDALADVWQNGNQGEHHVIRDYVLMLAEGNFDNDGCAQQGGLRSPTTQGYSVVWWNAYDPLEYTARWRELLVVHESGHILSADHQYATETAAGYDVMADISNYNDYVYPPMFGLANTERIKLCTTSRNNC